MRVLLWTLLYPLPKYWTSSLLVVGGLGFHISFISNTNFSFPFQSHVRLIVECLWFIVAHGFSPWFSCVGSVFKRLIVYIIMCLKQMVLVELGMVLVDLVKGTKYIFVWFSWVWIYTLDMGFYLCVHACVYVSLVCVKFHMVLEPR